MNKLTAADLLTILETVPGSTPIEFEGLPLHSAIEIYGAACKSDRRSVTLPLCVRLSVEELTHA